MRGRRDFIIKFNVPFVVYIVIFGKLTKETKEKCRNSRARAVKNAQIPFFKLSIMKMDNFDQLIRFTTPRQLIQ